MSQPTELKMQEVTVEELKQIVLFVEQAGKEVPENLPHLAAQSLLWWYIDVENPETLLRNGFESLSDEEKKVIKQVFEKTKMIISSKKEKVKIPQRDFRDRVDLISELRIIRKGYTFDPNKNKRKLLKLAKVLLES